MSGTPKAENTAGKAFVPAPTELPEASPIAAISEVRRLSGLTWEQLAQLFGVSRRALHFWASGKPLSAQNAEHLQRLLAVLQRVDRGSASANRAALLAPIKGVHPFDLLARHDYEDAVQLVGASPTPCTTVPLAPLRTGT